MQQSTKRRTAITLGIVLALVGLYALAGFFLVPYLAQRELARYAASIDRTAELAGLRFNPFTWTVEARGLALKERDGSPIGSVERLYADFDFLSIVRHAWSFSALEVEGADVTLAVGRDGTLNLARLAPPAKPPAAEQQPPSKPLALVVHDLKVERSTVRYADRSTPHPIDAVMSPISFHVTGLSTVAGDDGRYTLTAGLPGGASLSGQGTLALEPLASAGEIRLDGFGLAAAWPFLRDRVRIAEPRGTAAVHASYAFDRKGDRPAIRVTDADLQLKDVHLASADGKPLLDLAGVHASKAQYDGAANALVVPSLELQQGRLVAVLDAEGRLNWTELTPPTKDEKPGARWSARIDAVKLAGLAVRYEDYTRRTPLVLDVAKSDVALKVALASTGKAVRTTVDDLRVDLADIALSRGQSGDALVKLANARLEGGSVDTQEHAIAVGNVVLSGGRAALVREANGALPLLQAFETTKPAQPAPQGPRWRYRVASAALQETQLAVSDASLGTPLRYDLDVANLAVKGVDSEARSPIAFETAVKVAQGGSLSGSGTASQDFSRASAKLRIAGLSIAPLQGVVTRYATLRIRSGTVSADAKVDYARDAKPLLRVAGGARLANFALDEARTRQPFMKWKTLAADDVALTLAPDRLDIRVLTLEEPETAIVISKERKVNLTQVLKTSQNEPAPAKTAEPQKTSAPEAAPAFPVRVGSVKLQNATLDFADFSLVLPFSTRVTRLNGTIVGVSTDPQSRAELKLGGRIETSGYASAEGGVNLRRPTEFMDINVKFQNVQMPPLSPYTATFAGRKIDGGRLWLDLDYKIVNQQLAGANKILLENVELGERVEAPNALDLPLDLAIALLKDSQGRINMAVPVTGDVGNPRFDYGALIRNAISTAIGRIVSAPFRALASLFGGESGEEAGRVRFSAGSTRLYPPERESLQKVAKALQERPQLKVVVHAAFDPKRDGERLRLDPVRRELAQAMGMAGKPGEDLGPVAYSDAQTQRAIEQLFVARAGRDALREFSAQYAKEHGEAAAREGDGRRAYYEAMFDRLVELQPLPDNALQQLATARAQAIASALTEAGVDKSRVEIGDARTVTDGSEPTVNTELALAANRPS